MKRLAAVALIVAWVAFPACAQQRPVARGGSPAHNAPAPRGGFSGSARGSAPGSALGHGGYRGPAPVHGGVRPSAPPRFAGAHPPVPGGFRSPNRPLPPSAPGNSRDRQAGNGGAGTDFRRHHRMPYRPEHREGYPYGVSGSIGWVSPYVLGYPDSMDNGESQGSGDNAAAGPDAQSGDQGQPEALPPWPSSPPAQSSAMPEQAPAPANEEAVTLVFKDGRPPEQIHNYLLTAKILYVQDQQRRDIPLDQLDLIATAKVNHDSGVEFQLPDSNK